MLIGCAVFVVGSICARHSEGRASCRNAFWKLLRSQNVTSCDSASACVSVPYSATHNGHYVHFAKPGGVSVNRDLLYATGWIAFAAIVCFAPGWRVLWAVAPLVFVLARMGVDLKREGVM